METPAIFATILFIAAAICMIMAAPIVFAASASLSYALWFFGGVFGFISVGSIIGSYKD